MTHHLAPRQSHPSVEVVVDTFSLDRKKKKVHFIFQHENPNTHEWEEKHFDNAPKVFYLRNCRRPNQTGFSRGARRNSTRSAACGRVFLPTLRTDRSLSSCRDFWRQAQGFGFVYFRAARVAAFLCLYYMCFFVCRRCWFWFVCFSRAGCRSSTPLVGVASCGFANVDQGGPSFRDTLVFDSEYLHVPCCFFFTEFPWDIAIKPLRTSGATFCPSTALVPPLPLTGVRYDTADQRRRWLPRVHPSREERQHLRRVHRRRGGLLRQPAGGREAPDRAAERDRRL